MLKWCDMNWNDMLLHAFTATVKKDFWFWSMRQSLFWWWGSWFSCSYWAFKDMRNKIAMMIFFNTGIFHICSLQPEGSLQWLQCARPNTDLKDLRAMRFSRDFPDFKLEMNSNLLVLTRTHTHTHADCPKWNPMSAFDQLLPLWLQWRHFVSSRFGKELRDRVNHGFCCWTIQCQRQRYSE